jgi:hypothetical protein
MRLAKTPEREYVFAKASKALQPTSSTARAIRIGTAGLPIRRGSLQPQPRFKAVVQPAAYIVAGRAAAVNHFVMAAPAAQVARPAASAWFLTMYVTLCEPLGLPLSIDAIVQRTHRAGFVPDESMAG